MIWYRVCGLMEGIVHCLFLCTTLTSPFPVGATWSFHRITDLLMPQPGDSNESRLSTEDAFLELLSETLETMERPARGQFLEKFFKSIAHVDVNEKRSLDI